MNHIISGIILGYLPGARDLRRIETKIFELILSFEQVAWLAAPGACFEYSAVEHQLEWNKFK